MFEYTFEIIKRWNDEEKIVNRRKPIVIPILIYTGKEKWNNLAKIHYRDYNYTIWKENNIRFFYNVIKINELKMANLRQMESKLAKEFIKVKNKYLQIN